MTTETLLPPQVCHARCPPFGLLQVAAVQEEGRMARDNIVFQMLSSLTPTPSSQNSRTAHVRQQAAKQDVSAEHAAEHVEALQTVSRGSLEHSMHAEANGILPNAAMNGSCQDATEASSRRSAQPRENGRWPWAKPLPRPGSPTADRLPGLGSPVPPETEMSRAPAGHAAAVSHLNGNSHKANGSPDSVTL